MPARRNESHCRSKHNATRAFVHAQCIDPPGRYLDHRRPGTSGLTKSPFTLLTSSFSLSFPMSGMGESEDWEQEVGQGQGHEHMSESKT